MDTAQVPDTAPLPNELLTLQVNQLQARVDSLLEEVARLNTALTTASRNHREDIYRIGERMMEEANERDWCDVYDGVVADLNVHLQVKLQERTWDLDQEFTVYVNLSGSGGRDNAPSPDSVRRAIQEACAKHVEEYFDNVDFDFDVRS